jgi:two-component system, OmpR family, response regulator
MAALLERWGHEVRAANDGVSALASAQEFLPDAVLLDVGVNTQAGDEIPHHLRLLPGLRDILIAELRDDRMETWRAEVDHHLRKPANIVLLRGLLGALRHREGVSP